MVEEPLNDLLHSNRFDSNFHLACFDLREIEQAVDQIEQALSVVEKILEILSSAIARSVPSVSRRTKAHSR